jgi:hypothetical protein
MASPDCERAIAESVRVGNAIVKFISPNDVGLTGGHQCGYYLPKAVWQMFSPHKPEKGKNHETSVTVTWQDGRVTDSRVKWYGKGTRSEYRLTRFGKDFPFLTHDNVGDLLVLIPETHQKFSAFVLDKTQTSRIWNRLSASRSLRLGRSIATGNLRLKMKTNASRRSSASSSRY